MMRYWGEDRRNKRVDRVGMEVGDVEERGAGRARGLVDECVHRPATSMNDIGCHSFSSLPFVIGRCMLSCISYYTSLEA